MKFYFIIENVNVKQMMYTFRTLCLAGILLFRLVFLELEFADIETVNIITCHLSKQIIIAIYKCITVLFIFILTSRISLKKTKSYGSLLFID